MHRVQRAILQAHSKQVANRQQPPAIKQQLQGCEYTYAYINKHTYMATRLYVRLCAAVAPRRNKAMAEKKRELP